jgi:hypothetical protein
MMFSPTSQILSYVHICPTHTHIHRHTHRHTHTHTHTHTHRERERERGRERERERETEIDKQETNKTESGQTRQTKKQQSLQKNTLELVLCWPTNAGHGFQSKVWLIYSVRIHWIKLFPIASYQVGLNYK